MALSKYKLYRMTFGGLIRDIHDKMTQRCKRGNCMYPHLYINKFVPNPKRFRKFALQNRTLKRLYKQWKANDYVLRLRPVPDRINSNKGYHFDNIRFTTFSDNAVKASKKRRKN